MNLRERTEDIGRRLRSALTRAIALERVIPRPQPRRKVAETKLSALQAATFSKDDFDTKTALENGDYEAVMRALRNQTDPDALNNLGYAYAWLALKQPNDSYWGAAVAAFKKSCEEATGDTDAAKAKRARAEDNLAIVREASGLG